MSKKNKKIKPNRTNFYELTAEPVPARITIPAGTGAQYRVIAYDDMANLGGGAYAFRTAFPNPPAAAAAVADVFPQEPIQPEPFVLPTPAALDQPLGGTALLPELTPEEYNTWRDGIIERLRRNTQPEMQVVGAFGAPLIVEQRNRTMRTLTPEMARLADAYIELKNVNLPINNAPGIAQGTPGNTVFSERNEFKINKLKRLVSVEIEIAGCKLPDYIYPVTKKWQCSIVEDQSLPRMGFEINTAPANGDKFIDQMVDFDECFLKAGAWVNERCGMHTHADARDFNAYDVRRMIKLYSKLERGLFEIVPHERRHTKYATPCGDALMAKITSVAHPKTSKRRLIETLYTDVDDFKRMKETKAIDPLKRRRALNIHSWAFRKTFELRLPEGSVEAIDMINWAILWGTIVDSAYKMGERMIDSMGDDSYQLLLDLAPTAAIAKWIQQRKGDYK